MQKSQVNAPLLAISNLKKSFVAPDGSRHLIVDLPEFTLEARTQLGLAGESGSGKTTFLNLITGILKADQGTIQLDGELENFVRISAPSLEITAQVSGHKTNLTLQAVPNNATGEKVGDTSLFETEADWLKTTPEFDGVLKSIAVHGKTYSSLKFNFPKGIDEGAEKR